MRVQQITLPVLLLALWLPAGFAQTPPPMSETVTVQITNIEVIATGDGDNPVRGLTRDDFELLENGKKQTITNFFEAAGAVPASEQAVPLRLVFFFDQESLSPGNRRQVIGAAKDFLGGERLGPDDRVLIATWTRGMKVRLDWSNDRTVILQALDAMGKESGGASVRDLERQRIQTQIRGEMQQDSMPSAQGARTDFATLSTTSRSYATNVSNDTQSLIAGLHRFFRALSSLPGRKVMIYSGESLPTNPGVEIFRQLDAMASQLRATSSPSGLRAGSQTNTTIGDQGAFDLSEKIRTLGRVASTAGVRVYSIDPTAPGQSNAGTVEKRGLTDGSADFAAAGSSISGFQILTRATGGIALPGTKAPVALEMIGRDLTNYYSIGYRTPDVTDKERTLEVRVNKPGVRVRAPRSFEFRSLEQDMPSLVVLNAREAQPNDLKIALNAAPPVVEGKKKRVALQVMIPVENLTLAVEGARAQGGFAVFVCTGNSKGEITAVNRQSHDIDWPSDAPAQLRGKSMAFAVDLLLDPDTDMVSAGVIDLRSGVSGFERLKLSDRPQ